MFRAVLVVIGLAGVAFVGYGWARARHPDLDKQTLEALESARETATPYFSWVVREITQLGTEPELLDGEASAETSGASLHDGPPPMAVLRVREERPAEGYEAARYDLRLMRRALLEQRERGADVQGAAQAALDHYLPRMMREWIGTKYDYSGTSDTPKEGHVACGYYVSTVLEHAGFALDRVELARQPSEQIIRSLVLDPEVRRFSYAKPADIVAAVQESGPGVYVLGLDTHAGFLVAEGGTVTFCHSTRRERLGVVCEEAATSPSMASDYIVLGKLDDAPLLEAWLDGETVEVAYKDQPQPWAPLGTAEEDGAAPGAGDLGGDVPVAPEEPAEGALDEG